jgi:hypothetical protein
VQLGPNYRSFGEVAHQLAAEREAEIQSQLQRDRLNADVEQRRTEVQQRGQQGQLAQENFERQQALREFNALAENEMRQAEQGRLRKAQDTAFNANNFKRAVETGTMLDESGTKYVPVTEEEQPELYKARQEYLTDKQAKEKRLLATDRQNQSRFLAAQQLQYLKAGFKLEQVEDPESGATRLGARPLDPEKDPGEFAWYQEQQRLAADKVLTPEERIKIEEAKVGLKKEGKEEERQSKAEKALQDRYDRLDKAVGAEERALNRLEGDFDKLTLIAPTAEKEEELTSLLATAKEKGKQAEIVKAQRMLDTHLQEKTSYNNWQKRINKARDRVAEMERKRDAVGAQLSGAGEATQAGEESPDLSPSAAGYYSREQLAQIVNELQAMNPQQREATKAALVSKGIWAKIMASKRALEAK